MIGSFERLSNGNFRLSRTVQALFALPEALSKTVLTCVPEPPPIRSRKPPRSPGTRYYRLIQSAG
jgi:hypothetical protein